MRGGGQATTVHWPPPSTSALHVFGDGPFKISKLKWVTSVRPNTVRLATKTQGDNALRYGEKQPSMNLRDRPQETSSRDLERWLSSSENGSFRKKKQAFLPCFPTMKDHDKNV